MTPSRAAGLRALLVQLVRFGLVGAAGFAVDIVVFNALRLTVLSPEVIAAGPLLAKTVSTSLAILTNWVGNRFWTFSRQRQANTVREGAEFFAVSVAGMGIGLACLWVSHYVLGYTSVLADNIASNVIGLALGAAFRFSLYRLWVFAPSRAAGWRHPEPDGIQSMEVSSREAEPAA
ncbi:Putative flippase GtrA (transmembrane translocase of bactoprenol-linked glucose) [Paramicrobacterium humi]|uniref:Putative flippase GtrA (Transmembrane translocase of bactoprenol-linked glucose) n=1 Tax=Paramicrobacterium humi TaxID=640635 RepID=A0A1H4IT07_9MICO|nr:GtrA family protein [Microbacterium humi]SEB37157.1 Putative flippase GtrA (transmembrane translocase of bactoprenol-linked glucose) [Microbacterium humi]